MNEINNQNFSVTIDGKTDLEEFQRRLVNVGEALGVIYSQSVQLGNNNNVVRRVFKGITESGKDVVLTLKRIRKEIEDTTTGKKKITFTKVFGVDLKTKPGNEKYEGKAEQTEEQAAKAFAKFKKETIANEAKALKAIAAQRAAAYTEMANKEIAEKAKTIANNKKEEEKAAKAFAKFKEDTIRNEQLASDKRFRLRAALLAKLQKIEDDKIQYAAKQAADVAKAEQLASDKRFRLRATLLARLQKIEDDKAQYAAKQAADAAKAEQLASDKRFRLRAALLAKLQKIDDDKAQHAAKLERLAQEKAAKAFAKFKEETIKGEEKAAKAFAKFKEDTIKAEQAAADKRFRLRAVLLAKLQKAETEAEKKRKAEMAKTIADASKAADTNDKQKLFESLNIVKGFDQLTPEDKKAVKSKLTRLANYIKNDKVSAKELEDALKAVFTSGKANLANGIEVAIQDILRAYQTLPTKTRQLANQLKAEKEKLVRDAFKNIDFNALSPEKAQRVRAAMTSLMTTATNAKIPVNELEASLKRVLSGGPVDPGNALDNKIRRVGEALKDVNARSNLFLLSWQSIIRLLQVQLLQSVFYRFIGDIEQATQKAAEFQTKISEIRTISQDAQLKSEQWADSIRNLSDATGLELLDVTAAAYETISNQIAKGAEATRFLADAADLARVGVSSVAVASNVLSTVINAYGLSADKAREISAQLFQTMDYGRVKLSELDMALGTAAPLSASLGVSLQELNAVLGQLTIKGVQSTTAATGINNIMSKLLSPSKEMNVLLKEWGVGSGQAAVATFGFVGVMKKLGQELETNGIARLGDLLPDVRGLRAAIGALSAGSLEEIIKFSNNAAEANDKYAKAIEITNESMARTFIQDLNRVQNVLVVDIGTKVLALFQKFAELFGGLSNIAALTAKAFNTFSIALHGVADAFKFTGKWLDIFTLGMFNFKQSSLAVEYFFALAAGVGVFGLAITALGAVFTGYTIIVGAATTSTTLFGSAVLAAGVKVKAAMAFMTAHPLVLLASVVAGALTTMYISTVAYYEKLKTLREEYIAAEQKAVDKIKEIHGKAKDAEYEAAKKTNDAKETAIRTAYTNIRKEIAKQLKTVSAEFDSSDKELTNKLKDRIKETSKNLADIASEMAKSAYTAALDPKNLTQRFGKTKEYLEQLGKSINITKDFEQARNILKDMLGIAQDMVKALKESISNSRDKITDLTFDKSKAGLEGIKKGKRRDTAVQALISGKQAEIDAALGAGNIELAQKVASQINDLVGMIDNEKTANKLKIDLIDRQIQIEEASILLRTQQLEEAKAAEALALQARQNLELSLKTQAEEALKLSEKFDLLVKTEEELVAEIRKNTEALAANNTKDKDVFNKLINASTAVGGAFKPIEKLIKDTAIMDRVNVDDKKLTKELMAEFAARKANLDSGIKDNKSVADLEKEFNGLIKVLGQLKNLDFVDQASLKPFFQQLDEDLKDVARALAEKRGDAPAFKDGGFVDGKSGATDSLWVKATRGEHITNPYASATFAPLLEAINSVKGPGSAGPGNTGNHTNNIYVTYDNNKTPQHNVRELTRHMRREMGRGSTRLS